MNPPNPNSATPATDAAQWTQALALWASQINRTLIAEYEQGVAVATKDGVPPPALPMLYQVNGPLILQIENQENAAPLSTTAAQWAAILTQVQMPAPNTPPPVPPVTLTPIASGLWKVTVNSGYGPANNQVFVVDGVSYTAFWIGPFGPVEAMLTPVS